MSSPNDSGAQDADTTSYWDRYSDRILGGSVLLVLLIGTLAYSVIEGWSLVDSFYFSSVALTVVGFGDLTPSTDFSKIFTVFYIFSGIAIVGIWIQVRTKRTRHQTCEEGGPRTCHGRHRRRCLSTGRVRTRTQGSPPRIRRPEPAEWRALRTQGSQPRMRRCEPAEWRAGRLWDSPSGTEAARLSLSPSPLRRRPRGWLVWRPQSWVVSGSTFRMVCLTLINLECRTRKSHPGINDRLRDGPNGAVGSAFDPDDSDDGYQ